MNNLEDNIELSQKAESCKPMLMHFSQCNAEMLMITEKGGQREGISLRNVSVDMPCEVHTQHRSARENAIK
jgi:hypothetical protein